VKTKFICLFLIFFTFFCVAEKMKLYAVYTPSHAILKDTFFLPSLQDDFDIIIEFHEQTCPSASFLSDGWTRTTIRKVDLIIRAIKENWGKVFIFSDVDIQFFAPIEGKIRSLMQEKDMLIQRNNPRGTLCSGFFALRANENTLHLWQDVKKYMESTGLSDQVSLNKCIQRSNKQNKYGVVWDYLPNTFFGGGTLTGRTWRKGTPLYVPKNVVIHHANYTKGIDNKIAQLLYVKNVVARLR